MKFQQTFLISVFVICSINAGLKGQNHIQPENKTKNSLKIKDIASYVNNKIFIKDFMLSPADKNKVWVFTDLESFELDLADSSWANLSYRFGHFSKNLREERIYKDNHQNNLLWMSNHSLICYNLKAGNYKVFPDMNVTSMCFLKDYVMLGTLDGLYRYTRADGQMTRIEEVPLVIINDIQKIDDNLFLIDSKYEFNDQTKTLEVKYLDELHIYQIKIIDNVEFTSGYHTFTINTGDSLIKFDYGPSGLNNIISDRDFFWIIPQNLKNSILQYSKRDQSFKSYPVGFNRYYTRISDDKAGIWIDNSLSLLYFDKNDHSLRYINTDSNFTFRNMAVTDEFILSNTDHCIKLYSKENLLANSISLEKIIFEDNEFEKDKKLFYNTRDYMEKYQIFRYMVESYGSSVNQQIRQEIKNMKSYFITDAPYKPEELKEFIVNNLETIKDDDIRAALYLRLVNRFIWQGELDSALKTDSVLKNDYPTFRDESYNMKIGKVIETNLNIKNILSGPDKEDEKLWKVGNEYYNLFIYAGPETEVGINMTYPFTYFKQLVDTYPTSQYADNADFIMLRYDAANSDGDNSYNLEVIGQYQSILGKYPGTEYTPEIYFIIGDLYSTCEADYKEMKGYLEQALVYFQKIKNEFPGYEKMELVQSTMNRIEENIPRFQMELYIESNKEEYTIDEPVVLTFSLTNNAEISQQVEFYNSILMPNFKLDITLYPEGPLSENGRIVPFEEDFRDYNETWEEITINPGEFHEEEWNIKKNAWNKYGNTPGYFNLKEAGSYKIIAYMLVDYEYFIPSNTIWIEVR